MGQSHGIESMIRLCSNSSHTIAACYVFELQNRAGTEPQPGPQMRDVPADSAPRQSIDYAGHLENQFLHSIETRTFLQEMLIWGI